VPSIKVNEVSLEYEFWGSESGHPPMLLLHDALGSAKGWGEWPARLAASVGCRVYAWSRQGFGDSEPLNGALAPDYVQAEGLDTLPLVREALGLLDEVILVGHHDGAAIALVHAGGGSLPVRAVAAISPLLLVDEVTRAAIWSLSRTPPSLTKSDSNQDRTVSQWARLWTSLAFAQWNIDDFLRGITCPVLAARGEKDEFSSSQHVDRLASLVRDIHTVRLAGCRHMPHLERPGVLTTALTAFLQGLV
jgi:pimeloyl-ACP methyl ester carboxylesterase